MDSLLTWAAGLPLIPRGLLSLLVVILAVFILVVLWTPRPGQTYGGPAPGSLTGPTNDGGGNSGARSKPEEPARELDQVRSEVWETNRPRAAEPPAPSPSAPRETQAMVGSPGAIQAGRDIFIAPVAPVGPEASRKLSSDQCQALAGILARMRAALDGLVRVRASEEARGRASAIQNEASDWLREHLGAIQAEAFMSAEPSLSVPSNYPSAYGGTYQRMRGRLTYLSDVARRSCA